MNAFQGLKNLDYLNMNSNRLDQWKAQTFKGMTNLKKITGLDMLISQRYFKRIQCTKWSSN